ncbi:O-antigen ligase family protein [Janthinobacterium fluminis]|uniref:O-antigen ligase family protein n=1 Tax=Janthinobacterium fluminis TaxID=2987524 RepID=A0ABT5K4J4_9BURK|nr:O-antigen ligase family protein [Janthinobacterium fluminis]MDC8759615.1 O-antigen ligase family protein [Janthinobacterium fluminis]
MPGNETTRAAPPARLPAAAGWRQLPCTLALAGVIVAGFLLPYGHDAQRLLELAFLLLFGAGQLAAALAGRAGAWRGGAVRGWLAAFFVLGAISAARAFSPGHAAYEVGSLLLLLLLACRVGGEILRDGARHLLWVLRLCAAGCAAYAGKVLLVWAFALLAGVAPAVEELAPGFSNYRFLNHAQTISLPLLALLIALERPGGKARALWIAVAGFWWALLIVFGARGSVLGLAAGALCAGLLRRGQAGAVCRALFLSALLGAAIYALLFVALPALRGLAPFGVFTLVAERTGGDNPTSGRGVLWRAALAMLEAQPWLGAGPLHFAHYAGSAHFSAHPHSWALQIAAEWGVPALLCLCAAIGLAMLRLLQTAARIASGDARNQAMLAAWIVGAVAILVDGLFSGLIVMPVSQLLLALYLGCALGWAGAMAPAGAARPRRASPAASLLAAALLAAALAALLYAPRTGIVQLIAAGQIDSGSVPPPGNTQHPRLWRDGYF